MIDYINLKETSERIEKAVLSERAIDNVGYQMSVKVSGKKLKEAAYEFINSSIDRVNKLSESMEELQKKIGHEPDVEIGWNSETLMANNIKVPKRYSYDYPKDPSSYSMGGNDMSDEMCSYNNMIDASVDLIMAVLKTRLIVEVAKDEDSYEFTLSEAVRMGIDINDIEK